MALPYIILVLGYALLASLFLWVSISIKGKWIIKFAVTPVILWFGLFLYYIPPQLAGYPSEQEIVEDRVIVRYFSAQRPSKTEEGYIIVVVDTRFFKDKDKTKTFLDTINPETYTNISDTEYLRLYRLPWDDELDRNMQSAKKQKKLIILKKNKKDKNGNGDGKDGKGKKGKGKKKKGSGGKPGNSEGEGEGGTGGSARNSKDKAKYTVEALTPNIVERKPGS